MLDAEGNGVENKEGKDTEHSHAFWRDGEEKRVVSVGIEKDDKGGMKVSMKSGIKDLLGTFWWYIFLNNRY